MAAHAEFPSEHRSFDDARSGRRIHQITAAPAISHPPYFLQRAFTPDGALIFTSFRTGSAQLFEVDFPGGPIRQLTVGAPIHAFSPAILPGGGELLFVRGGSVWALDRRSLRETCVVDFGAAQLGECSLSADGAWITAAIRKDGQQGIAVGRLDGADWHVIPFPRTVIHPQFHPLEPEWLEFAADPAPRLHRVRRDGSGLECLHDHGNDEFVVHETFLGQTGDLVFTVWPRALRRMNWHTREITDIAAVNAWHLTPTRDGTHVLYDTNHPDRGIQLLEVASGREEFICESLASNQGSQWKTSRYALAEDFARARSEAQQNLSWMETTTDTVYGPQWTHPHPSFSPNEDLVAFASDRTGVTQVYVAELKPRAGIPQSPA
jgi:hypothetical protein